MDSIDKGVSHLEAEEERLRELVHSKKRRRSQDHAFPTENHVESTQDGGDGKTGQESSATAITTSSSSQQPIKNVHTQTNEAPSSSVVPQGQSEPTESSLPTKARSFSNSESRSCFSRSSGGSSDPKHPSSSRGRKRERRRMNREARKRGETPPEDNRYRGPPPSYHRGGGPPRWERGGGHPPRDFCAPPDYRGPPPRGEYDYSEYRTRSGSPRGRHPRRGRSRSRSHGSEYSQSVSTRSDTVGHSNSRTRSHASEHGSRRRSHSDSKRGRSGSNRDNGSRGSGSRKRRRSRSPSTSSASSSSGSSSSSSSGEDPIDTLDTETEDESSPFSKDQRTVFVSQLVMRTREKDIRRYFRKKVGCQVREVILLRDKRTGSHKGCAYVQFGRIEDVNKAVGVAGQAPDFQRFPILVKPSEAEKNYVINASSSVVTASMMGNTAASKPLVSSSGKLIESQKVYVGGLDPSVNESHVFALFSQFGQLEKVSLQMDPSSKASRGYAFLAYRDPKEANLAIQTMSNQILAGKSIKTGWASQNSTIQGVEIVTSDQFPEDAAQRASKALMVLARMSGASDVTAVTNASISSTAEKALDAAMAGAATPAAVNKAVAVPTVAEARATLAPDPTTVVAMTNVTVPGVVPPGVKLIGHAETPTNNVLVHNMFDKDKESGDSWPAEIEEEFKEECSKFGKILRVKVMSKEPGGQIYAVFDTLEAAKQCAANLAGRWFDKRQLRVDYVKDEDVPES